jgi:hypothetical protein
MCGTHFSHQLAATHHSAPGICHTSVRAVRAQEARAVCHTTASTEFVTWYYGVTLNNRKLMGVYGFVIPGNVLHQRPEVGMSAQMRQMYESDPHFQKYRNDIGAVIYAPNPDYVSGYEPLLHLAPCKLHVSVSWPTF